MLVAGYWLLAAGCWWRTTRCHCEEAPQALPKQSGRLGTDV
jgi:hypothetical protein